MKLTSALLTVAISVAASRAAAEPYRWAGNTATALTFVDMQTLTRAGTEVDYWTLFLPLPTQAVPQLGTIYVRGHQHVDCSRRVFRDQEVLTYKMNGEQIGQRDQSTDGDKPVKDGSAAAAVLEFVCMGKTRLGSVELTGSDPIVAAKVRSQLPRQP